MATTLAELVTRTRFRLKDEYKNYTVVASAFNSTVNSALFRLGDHMKFKNGDIIEVDDEVIKIIENPMEFAILNSALDEDDTYFRIGPTANSAMVGVGTHLMLDDEMLEVTVLSAASDYVYLTGTRGILGTVAVAHDANIPVSNPDMVELIRGYAGSSAAFHSATVTVNVVDTYTAFEIEQALREAAYNLKSYTYESYFTDTRKPESIVGNTNTAAGVSQWTATQDAVTPVLVTGSDVQEGNGAIGLGLTVAQSAATYGLYENLLSTAIDATDHEYLNLKFVVKDLQDTNDVDVFSQTILELYVGTNSSNYYNNKVSLADIAEGTNQISVPFKRGTVVGTPSLIVHSSIQYFGIKINENANNATNVAVSDIVVDDIKLSPFPYTNSSQRLDLPKDVFHVGQIDMLTGSRTGRVPLKNFRTVGNDDEFSVYFDTAMDQGNPLEIHGSKMYDFDATDALNIPEALEEFMALYATKQVLEARMPLEMRFDKYSSKTNRENATMLDYQRAKREYEASLAQIKGEMRKPLPALRIDFGQRYGT